MEGVVDRFCKRTCDKYSLFDWKVTVDKLTGLTLLNESLPSSAVDTTCSSQNNDNYSISEGDDNKPRYTASTVKYFCPLCNVKFPDERKMRDHYKTEWHLYNLNLSRQGLRCVSQSCFEEDGLLDFSSSTESESSSSSNYNSACESADDEEEEEFHDVMTTRSDGNTNDVELQCPDKLSFNVAASSSNSEEADNVDDTFSQPQNDSLTRKNLNEFKLQHFNDSAGRHKIFFRNKNGEIIALYRSLLYSKQKRPETIQDLLRRVNLIRECKKWAVLLYSGGSFAGGIFNERNEVVHKTFKRYTVRKKQGGGQSSQDAKGGAPKSAGASLRRYGERAIRQEINDLLHKSWREEMLSCDLILYWTPKSQRRVLFPSSSGDSSSLTFTLGDDRVRSIPLIVRDVTYSQVKALHLELSTYEVYDAGADLTFLNQTGSKQLRKLSESGGNILQESLSGRLKLSSCCVEVEPNYDGKDEEFNDKVERRTFIDNSKSHLKKSKQKKKQLKEDHSQQQASIKNSGDSTAAAKSDPSPLSPKEIENNSWRDRFLVAVACGDIETCESLVQSKLSSLQDPSLSVATDEMRELLCQPLGGGYTLLHIASQNSSPEVVRLLLEHGCDPAIKGQDGSTAYQKACKTGHKSMTQVYRRFRYNYPDKFDYEAAQIPPALDPEKEAQKKARETERRKLMAKQKKEKEKVRRAEEKKQQEEQEEKNRFLNLSDREKRALALERRLLLQAKESNQELPVFNRCFQCAIDISGKVPFEYNEFRFCSTSCLRVHRTATKSNQQPTTNTTKVK